MQNASRLLLVFLITPGVVAEVMAGGGAEGAAANQTATITFLSLGDESARMGDFLENEFAARIMAGLDIELDVFWSPWGQYWDQLTLTLAAQEPLDFYWDGFGSLAPRNSRREAVPLTELLEQHGQDILRIIGRDRFSATTMNDQITAIPSRRGPISEKFYSFLLRQDIMDLVGVDSIESLADLNRFAELGLAQDPTLRVFAGCGGHGTIGGLSREFFIDEKPTFFGPSNRHYVDELSNDFRVDSLFDNREHVRFMVDTNAAYVAKGWIPESVLTEPNNDGGRFFTGSYLVRTGAVTRPLQDLNGVRQTAPQAVLKEHLLNPDMPLGVKIVFASI